MTVTLETIDALIKEKFDNNAKQHNEIIKRQDRTNGNVCKNTGFRQKVVGALTVIGFMGFGSLVAVILLWAKVLAL